MSSLTTRIAIGLSLAVFYTLPFLALLIYSFQWSLPSFDETWPVFWLTVSQALMSAAASVLAGSLGALGLLWVRDRFGSRIGQAAEYFALLPNLIPVLVLLLAVMKFLPFARGWIGIVLVHTFLNSGIVAVAIERILRQKVGSLSELAWIEGASNWLFLTRGAFPAIASELRMVFLSIFALCFASFSVPLLIGGASATTIEVLIWQKIRMSSNWSNWSQAIGLATLQLIAVVTLSLLLRKSQQTASLFSGASRVTRMPLLNWKWGYLFIVLPPVLVVAGLFESLPQGMKQVLALEPLMRELPSAIIGSTVVALGTGFLSIITLLALAYFDPKGRVREILLGYVAPSSVLTGFALLILWRETGLATYFKLMIGLTLLTTPAFYRLRWDATLQALRGQRTIAWSLGASEGLIFRQIVFPQVIQAACFIAGLAALWAWGDFAFSAVVAERSVTVALLAQNLLGFYRLAAATVLIWIVVLGGFLTFVFFDGVGRVLGSRSHS